MVSTSTARQPVSGSRASDGDRSDRAATGSGKAPRLHLAHVEGLRALAALVVYLNHAYAQSWNPMQDQYPTGVLSIFSYSLVAGHFAVSVFIAISGFCLALPVIDAADHLRGGALDFLKRRARRILPPYYAALFLSLGLIWTVIGEPTGSLWDVPIEVDEIAIASHLLLVQDVFRTGRINYVFWSIAVEWHLYFLFPLLLLLLRKRGLAAMVIGSLVVGYAVSLTSAGTRLERACPHYIGLFALGVLSAYLVRSGAPELERLRRLPIWGGLAIASLVGVFSLTALFGYHVPPRRMAVLDLFMGFFACALLVQTSSRPAARVRKLCEWRPLVVIGTFSYSLYLVHAPFLQLIWQYVLSPFDLSHEQTFLFLMTIGLGMVLAGAYGFFRAFERPFMTRRAPAVPLAPVRSAITQ